jgi:hypothetical protein
MNFLTESEYKPLRHSYREANRKAVACWASVALALAGCSASKGPSEALLFIPTANPASAPALRQLVEAVRPCVGAQGGPMLPDLPTATGQKVDVQLGAVLAEPGLHSHGYWHWLGRRASDGAVFIVSAGGIDGSRHLFGPVQTTWSCVRTTALPRPVPETQAQ